MAKEEDMLEQEESKSAYADASEGISSPKSGSSKNYAEDTLKVVVSLQKVSGNWEATSEALSIFGLKLSNLVMPAGIASLPSDKETIWMTILLLFLLETKFVHKKNSWSLIFKKGSKWLETKGINYKDYQADATAIVQ